MEEIINHIFKIAKEHEKKNLVEMTLKCVEEVGELSQAVLSYKNVPGCGYKGLDIDNVTEEIADVLIVTLALASRANINVKELEKVMRVKLTKWLSHTEQ